MNHKIIIFVLLIFCGIQSTAQKIYTKNGQLAFFSKAPLENISATSNEAMSVLNVATGEIQFSVLIRSFHFKKSLMEEHFNENYMESNKFPKAVFKGQVTDVSKVNFSADGSYVVTVSGNLTIHGITNPITTTGTINIKSGIPSANSTFKVKVADYKIAIPKIVKDNIAETVDITVSCVYDQKI
jgi:polyisoprenoid-binding protein YceI